uniref:PEP-CTERM protein-sorting domain-containing protein n=1 Tax=Solibacter usitatus (strain Ellin6076) TaxID=234267 RepID=Q01NS5_SOLUE
MLLSFPSGLRSVALATLALGITSVSLPAAVINDPPNDFLNSFTTGPENGDLDVLTAEVFFDGANFTFTSTENGLIGATDNEFFVWGVDRGLHQPFFHDFAPNVLFDIVVVLQPNLTGLVIDFSPTNPDAPITLPAGSVTKSGNTITGIVPLADLPTRGSLPADYKVNFWPRVGLDPSNNAQISDFAPDTNDIGVTTPEPGTVLFLGGGLVLIALSRLRASHFRT